MQFLYSASCGAFPSYEGGLRGRSKERCSSILLSTTPILHGGFQLSSEDLAPVWSRGMEPAPELNQPAGGSLLGSLVGDDGNIARFAAWGRGDDQGGINFRQLASRGRWQVFTLFCPMPVKFFDPLLELLPFFI
jgi:hypothetical protein